MSGIEPRFRLRMGSRVVGYMRKVANSMIVYSRDGFWWSGNKIEYHEVDEWTGLKDKNNRPIYEWDILYYKRDPDAEYLQGVILWEGNAEEFGIRDIKDGSFIPLEVDGIKMFRTQQLEVFSYLFINPDLQEYLGVDDN